MVIQQEVLSCLFDQLKNCSIIHMSLEIVFNEIWFDFADWIEGCEYFLKEFTNKHP